MDRIFIRFYNNSTKLYAPESLEKNETATCYLNLIACTPGFYEQSATFSKEKLDTSST